MAQRNCTSQAARVSVCIFHESRSSTPRGYKNSNLLYLPETLNTIVQIFPLCLIKAWVEENFSIFLEGCFSLIGSIEK